MKERVRDVIREALANITDGVREGFYAEEQTARIADEAIRLVPYAMQAAVLVAQVSKSPCTCDAIGHRHCMAKHAVSQAMLIAGATMLQVLGYDRSAILRMIDVASDRMKGQQG